jgi:hypothetical protein
MRLAQGKAKILRNRKGNANVVVQNQPIKTEKKGASVGPAKSWSKVIVPAIKKESNKRKEACVIDSDYDVKRDDLDIMPLLIKGRLEERRVLVMFLRHL